MDPNLNRNSMGSRAGTALKPKFGAGGVGAPSRQGTARGVKFYPYLGIESSWRSWINSNCSRKTANNWRWYKWSTGSGYEKTSV